MSTKINQNQNHETKNSNLNDNKSYNESDYIHYVYKITNLTNNKYYIGIHSLQRKKGKEPVNDGYWGSGTYIKEAIKKEGKKNFKKEILKTFSTREEAMNEEGRLVTIKEVNDPNCYNAITGGKNDMGMGNKNYITVRLKADINKKVRVSKDIYFNNKDIYVHSNGLSYFLKTKNLSEKELKTTIKRQKSINKEKDNKNYTIVRRLLDPISLNIVSIYEREIKEDELYTKWFPVYFLDKSTNTFITEDYLISKLNLIQNKGEISKCFGISHKSLDSLIKYYRFKDNEFDSKLTISTKEKFKRYGGKSSYSSGKIIVNKDDKEKLIDKSDLNVYLENGWLRGKSISINKDELIDYYCLGNCLKKCGEHFKIDYRRLKPLIIKPDFEYYWFYKGTIQIRLQVNLDFIDRLLNNGWKLGKP